MNNKAPSKKVCPVQDNSLSLEACLSKTFQLAPSSTANVEIIQMPLKQLPVRNLHS